MKVILNPIKEIYINQIVKSDIQRLTKIQAVRDRSLSWCNGYLFLADGIENSNLVKKQSEGILYLDSFVYAECKERIEVSKWNGYSIEVIDFTGHDTTEKLIECIIADNIDYSRVQLRSEGSEGSV